MQAALITAERTLELRDFEEPTPAPNGVVVDIELCGVCGTDVHAYQSGSRYNPAICGHEWTGPVSAVGSGVKDFTEGDRVVIATATACGSCDACRAGLAERCLNAFLVTTGRDPLAPSHGGFAPRLAVGANRVLKVNPALTVEQAAQVEPATVAFHAVRRCQPRLGDVAVVQGAGPIGLTTLQWVRAAGAGEIIVIEPNETRRRLAAELGATRVAQPDNAKELINEHTHGLGADIVYECAGLPATIQGAVDLARRGGSMCLVGLASGMAGIDPASWLVKEIAVTAALAYDHHDFEMAMGMIADGRIALEPMHTATVGLDGLDGALADLASGQTLEVKVLVDPTL